MATPVPWHEQSLTRLAAALGEGALTSESLVRHYLARIADLDDRLHAYITVCDDSAIAQARAVDRRRAGGEALPPLSGIPLAVKDSIPTKGIRTTANSRLLEDWVPESDAVAIGRLRRAGAIVLGKANLNEFGWALPAESDLAPPPRNPWNPTYVAVGSSSGSAVALAAGLCAAAIGTDGGGSTRLPAGQLGLVGIKATHGRISRQGMDDSSISEISPLACTVADAALLLGAMAGPGADDWQTWPQPVPSYAANLEADVRGWRIGVPRRYIDTIPLEPAVAAAFAAALERLAWIGLDLVDVDFPGMDEARAANFVVLNAEAYTDHAASLRAHPEKYGHSARVYHWMGAFLSATDYLNALKVGRRVRQIVQAQLQTVRALVMPTSPVITAEAARRPKEHRSGLNAAFTAPFNLTGHPAISLPCGMSETTGLPIGFQLVGPYFDELTLFQLAHAYEQVAGWAARHPVLA